MTKPADKFTGTATKLAVTLNLHPMALRSTDIEILRQALEATDKAATERVGEMLKDPAFVNVNIMRGGIVLPSNYVRTTDTDGPYKAALEAEYQRGKMEERERCALIADGFHDRSIKWAKTVRGLEHLIDETDSSRIAAAIRKGDKHGQG